MPVFFSTIILAKKKTEHTVLVLTAVGRGTEIGTWEAGLPHPSAFPTCMALDSNGAPRKAQARARGARARPCLLEATHGWREPRWPSGRDRLDNLWDGSPTRSCAAREKNEVGLHRMDTEKPKWEKYIVAEIWIQNKDLRESRVMDSKLLKTGNGQTRFLGTLLSKSECLTLSKFSIFAHSAEKNRRRWLFTVFQVVFLQRPSSTGRSWEGSLLAGVGGRRFSECTVEIFNCRHTLPVTKYKGKRPSICFFHVQLVFIVTEVSGKPTLLWIL